MQQVADGGKAFEAEVSKDGKSVPREIKIPGADKGKTFQARSDGSVPTCNPSR